MSISDDLPNAYGIGRAPTLPSATARTTYHCIIRDTTSTTRRSLRPRRIDANWSVATLIRRNRRQSWCSATYSSRKASSAVGFVQATPREQQAVDAEGKIGVSDTEHRSESDLHRSGTC